MYHCTRTREGDRVCVVLTRAPENRGPEEFTLRTASGGENNPKVKRQVIPGGQDKRLSPSLLCLWVGWVVGATIVRAGSHSTFFVTLGLAFCHPTCGCIYGEAE